MLALLRGEMSGQLNINTGVQVRFLIWLAYGGHAVPLEPEDLAVLRGRRDLQTRGFSAERHDERLASENGRCDRHTDLRIQVAPFELEYGVRRQTHAQVQIPRGRASVTLFSLATDADARPLDDARRNAYVDRARVTVVPQ